MSRVTRLPRSLRRGPVRLALRGGGLRSRGNRTSLGRLLLNAIDEFSSADQVAAARAAYDALSPEGASMVSAAAYAKLTDREAADASQSAEKANKETQDKAAQDIADAKKAADDAAQKAASDQAAAMEAVGLIALLPDTATALNAKAVGAARAAYDGLTDAQKKIVPAKVAEKLSKAEKQVSADQKARKVKSVTVNVKKVTAKAIKKAVKKVGGNLKYVKSVTLGKKVSKVSPKAFANCKKVTKLVVKTKKLKAKSVANALSGSKVKTVKVKVGKAKANKSYAKKYKKIFTKKNCGKKATVKA